MKTNQQLFKVGIYTSILCLILIACNGCSKDEPAPDDPTKPQFSNDDASDFNSAVANLSAFNQPEESGIVETTSTEPEREGETELECFTQTFKGAPGFSELFTLDPTTDVIYPGSMLKGETIPTGEYARINKDRAPITMSISLNNIKKTSVVVNNPNKLSEVRAGVNELLSLEVTGATPAQLEFDKFQVYSEQQLSIGLGANYRDKTKDISGSFDFNTTTVKKKYVLKFIQKYFTIDLDSPGEFPSDLFTDLPSIESLGSTSPVYVSSVTYGRMVLYTVESESSITDVETAFNAAIDAGGREGGFELDIKSKEILEKSNIKALIIGGSGASAAQTIGGDSLSKIYDFIAEDGNYSQDSPGSPLSYKLSYVKEGFPAANVVLATEYQARNCDVAYPEYLATIVNITGTQASDTEVNGKLRVKMWVGGERLDINDNGIDDGKTWSVDTDNFVDVQDNKTHTINESYTFKPYRPNMATDYVECSGELYDWNGIFGNESLGNAGGINAVILDSLKLNVPDTTYLNFKKGITAQFIITRKK
ncbi:thiol-activated cytolysin family protein [Flagellimonas sp. 389]|uniref:thiol-activated cytolysin family protein n=1 Tax=Flagellimonas sp. 389 TaxID=2835862 RepID=UPI001BD1DB5A|nr:thiol-activated cytolysin family protein [Flagellimonas sp. 389]MBS9463027.1 thiol-activated cytolysin family protein [Flagellimonas sp. 389]